MSAFKEIILFLIDSGTLICLISLATTSKLTSTVCYKLFILCHILSCVSVNVTMLYSVRRLSRAGLHLG
jgi:hypothetical protein